MGPMEALNLLRLKISYEFNYLLTIFIIREIYDFRRDDMHGVSHS